ncbi:hypothetical protein BJ165DRAFT_1528545 [Panaeolus papilionaceus]|nr:hypothetical protein BJ165DRAFT_1528545 [Panaeolus papilionaceus]
MSTSITITHNSSQSSVAQAANPSNPKQSAEHLFGELSSTYGFNGAVPNLPSRSSSPLPKVSSNVEPHQLNNTSATSTVTPTSTGTPNYEESYGNLVSVTGLGTAVPCLNLPHDQKHHKSSTAPSTPSTLSRVPSSSGIHTSLHKDYEHGFGQLVATQDSGSTMSSFSMIK